MQSSADHPQLDRSSSIRVVSSRTPIGDPPRRDRPQVVIDRERDSQGIGRLGRRGLGHGTRCRLLTKARMVPASSLCPGHREAVLDARPRPASDFGANCRHGVATDPPCERVGIRRTPFRLTSMPSYKQRHLPLFSHWTADFRDRFGSQSHYLDRIAAALGAESGCCPQTTGLGVDPTQTGDARREPQRGADFPLPTKRATLRGSTSSTWPRPHVAGSSPTGSSPQDPVTRPPALERRGHPSSTGSPLLEPGHPDLAARPQAARSFSFRPVQPPPDRSSRPPARPPERRGHPSPTGPPMRPATPTGSSPQDLVTPISPRAPKAVGSPPSSLLLGRRIGDVLFGSPCAPS